MKTINLRTASRRSVAWGLVGVDPLEEAIVVSNGVAEGAIDAGVYRFRFSGKLANVHLVDWNGVPAPESFSTPTVHIDYNVPAQ